MKNGSIDAALYFGSNRVDRRFAGGIAAGHAGIVKGGGQAADQNYGNPQPATPAQHIVPDHDAPDAGKDDAGVLQVGGDQRFAQAIGAGHGHLRQRGRDANCQQ